MNQLRWISSVTFVALLGIVVSFFVAGCQQGTPTSSKSKSQPTADKQADEALVKAQGYCAVQTKNKLGSMGEPYKIMIKGQPVFLCCKSCEEEARKDEEKTLATVEKLKKKNQK